MGFKRKFQIGDKVKVIEPNDPYYKQIGKVISYYSPYDSKGFYNVKFENGTRSYYPNSLEKVEESKEEIKISEKIELPLKEGQIVTLLDGKQYQVIKNNTSQSTCSFCSLGKAKCGENRCNITHINGKPSCPLVIPAGYYFKLYEDQKTEDNSSESINSIEKDSSIIEVGIITKVNFTLTDFKSEEIIHSKFTVL